MIRYEGERENGNFDIYDLDVESGWKTIVIWVAICKGVKSDLNFVPENSTVDSKAYTENILDPLLIHFCMRYVRIRVDVWAEKYALGHKIGQCCE